MRLLGILQPDLSQEGRLIIRFAHSQADLLVHEARLQQRTQASQIENQLLTRERGARKQPIHADTQIRHKALECVVNLFKLHSLPLYPSGETFNPFSCVKTDLGPFEQKLATMIHTGDCLEILPTLADESAQIVLADPPYNIGKDFGNDSDRQPMDDYLQWCDRWIAECLRILKPNGTMFV